MKKQILDALKAKFIGVSESILSRIADKLAKTVLKEDDVAAAIEGVTFNQVLENYGDSRATEAQQTAVSTYEKKHGLKDGQKVQGGEPTVTEPTIEPTNNGDNVPAWAKSIIDSNKALRDEISVLKGDKIADSNRQKLLEVIKDAPEKFRQRTEKSYSRMSFKDDNEFAAYLEETTIDAKEEIANATAKGAVFGRPAGGGATTEVKPADKEVATVAAAMGL